MTNANWNGKVVNHYGDNIFILDTPLVLTDKDTGKNVLVEKVVDNTHTTAGPVVQWFYVTGSKQKKDGSFYGNFTTLSVDVPRSVLEAIVEFKKSK